jgi:haloalkane dehalogenase
MTGETCALPFAPKKYLQVKGRRMAYIDEGEGDAIVFQHGNPTSCYLWRNVMPHLREMGRLVACDLIGMGDSEKLTPSGPDRYHYEEQRNYLFALWDMLGLGDRVVLVLHDWGSTLGFEWAMQNPGRVQGIAYMEAIVAPLLWSDDPEGARRSAFRGFRSSEGESLVLERNVFVERVLPGGTKRQLTDAEMAEYRRPFLRRVKTAARPSAGLAISPSRVSHRRWCASSRPMALFWLRANFPSSSSRRTQARS